MTVVLMYHALFRDGDTAQIDQQDLPYAVSEANFVAQLDRLTAKRVGLFAGDQAPEVVISFDDGHHSNLTIAAPLLLERGLSAYFFVTSGFIGARRGFMSSGELRALADMPGMCIGSHGVTHRFFDDLTEGDAQDELVSSRQRLEAVTGRDCLSISFPGGRYNERTLTQLQRAGYRQWFGSEIATLSVDRCFRALEQEHPAADETELWLQSRRRPIDRVAVRRSTSIDEFARMIGPDEAFFRHHRRRSQAKSLVRRVLGNRLYHGLYKSLSAR